MITWTEISRRPGAYEVGDAHNSVYVPTLEDAAAVLRHWYPEHWSPPLDGPFPTLDRLNAAVAAYCEEEGVEDLPVVSVVEE